jgi:hypothetical protein
MRTLPPPSILPSMVMSAAISDSFQMFETHSRPVRSAREAFGPRHSRNSVGSTGSISVRLRRRCANAEQVAI